MGGHEGGRQRTPSRRAWSVGALAVMMLSGYAFVSSGVTSRGADLRPAGGDVSSLLQDRAHRVEVKREQARHLEREIDALSSTVGVAGIDELLASVQSLQEVTGLTAAEGPGVRVTLTDAPRTADAPGVDPNVLVVHQQDIQGFVNALWAGGAEAISLQGQRLISTTGIKCVGSTVVLDGVPYSPPYVIEAIGNESRLRAALDASPEVDAYESYVRRYGLGLETESVSDLVAAAYAGTVSLQHASAVDPA